HQLRRHDHVEPPPAGIGAMHSEFGEQSVDRWQIQWFKPCGQVEEAIHDPDPCLRMPSPPAHRRNFKLANEPYRSGKQPGSDALEETAQRAFGETIQEEAGDDRVISRKRLYKGRRIRVSAKEADTLRRRDSLLGQSDHFRGRLDDIE